MMKWSMIGLIGLLSTLGCGGESSEQPVQATEAVSEEASEASAKAEVKSPEAEKVAPSRATRSQRDPGALRMPPTGGTEGSKAAKPVTRASTRVAPPKGMDAHPDFVGARVGLIHTANVMGEVDPCG